MIQGQNFFWSQVSWSMFAIFNKVKTSPHLLLDNMKPTVLQSSCQLFGLHRGAEGQLNSVMSHSRISASDVTAVNGDVRGVQSCFHKNNVEHQCWKMFRRRQMQIVPIFSESSVHPQVCIVVSAAHTAAESQLETAGCHAAHMRSDRKSVCQIQKYRT